MFCDFVDGVDVADEHCSTAVLLDSEIVEYLSWVLAFSGTFLVLLPVLADYFAATETSDWKLHCCIDTS